MVFGTDSPCPVRYPLLFGLVSMLFYLAFNEATWLPESVTSEMLSLALIGVGGIVGIAFLALVIEAYGLDPPQTHSIGSSIGPTISSTGCLRVCE